MHSQSMPRLRVQKTKQVDRSLSQNGKDILKQAMTMGGGLKLNPGEFPILCVRVVRAANLSAMDLFSLTDPYAIVQYGEDRSISPAFMNAGADCEIDWSVQFPFQDLKPQPLKIIMMDFDSRRCDDLIGEVSIDPYYFARATAVNPLKENFQIFRKSKLTKRQKHGGMVSLEVFIDRFVPPAALAKIMHSNLSPIQPFPLPSLRVVSNWNRRGGVIRYALDGGVFQTFRTWQINLWAVKPSFGDTVSWNRDYTAAQKIFSNSFTSKLARGVIHAQYGILYSSDQSRGLYKEGHVTGIKQLFTMLNNGRNKDNMVIRFTYVIRTDGVMHFSETSSRFGQDLLSKHALHANANPEVFFAGEFFIDTESERYHSSNVPALIIDNNSGTYAPPKERLLKLTTLLELNFGFEFPIYALDREDQRLKTYFLQNKIE